jgi:hypothetical protein
MNTPLFVFQFYSYSSQRTRRSAQARLEDVLGSTLGTGLGIRRIIAVVINSFKSGCIRLNRIEKEIAHPLPPSDVWMEAILGFGIIFLGELIRPGSSLHPVTGRKNQPLVAPAYRTRDFDIYSTRGSAL